MASKKAAQKRRARTLAAILGEEIKWESKCIILTTGYPPGLTSMSAAGITAESSASDDEKRINDLLVNGYRLARELATGNKVMLFFEREVK